MFNCSGPGHFMVRLLQYALHGATLEEHSEVIGDAECGSVVLGDQRMAHVTLML